MKNIRESSRSRHPMSCVIGKTFQQALQPYKYLFADTGTHVPFFFLPGNESVELECLIGT